MIQSPTVLITGCSSGFGRLLVTAFLDSGWSVIASLRDSQGRAGTFTEDKVRCGDRLTLLELDVADAKHRAAAVRAVGGKLDCLINNAGYGLFGALEDMSEEQLRRQMEVNFFGAVLLTRDLLPALRSGRGRVINISSILGLTGFPLSSAYCASKFALEGMSEALYHELRPHGVQVAVVEPGGFRTDFAKKLLMAEGAGGAKSAYRVQTANLRKWQEKRSSGPGVPPGKVVSAVVRLASCRTMPLRTVLGADAKAAHLMQRWLPWNWAPALMARVFGKALMKEPA